LNHTLLTTFTARAMGIDLRGMIVNRMPEHPDDVESEAPHMLASLASTGILGVLPEISSPEEEKISSLSRIFEELPTYGWLLDALNLSGKRVTT
jgi:dethiobiotin synthetase